MPKFPNNSIAQFYPQFFENRVIKNIKWVNFSIFNKITYLPANTTIFTQNSIKLSNQFGLIFQILIN